MEKQTNKEFWPEKGSGPELLLAVEAVKAAGKIILERYENRLSRKEENTFKLKGENDPVTDVDVASHEAISKIIKAKFPGHLILSEEGEKDEGLLVPSNKPKWIIDPLDGTDNFINQVPWFSVSIALEKNSEIAVGAVYNPLKDELFYAEKGKGAYLNGRQIHAGAAEQGSSVVIFTQYSKKDEGRKARGLAIREFLKSKYPSTSSPDSMPYDLCLVACGKIDAFVGSSGWAWDKAAGKLIAEEAGAIVSQPDAEPADIYDRYGGIIAVKKDLHKQIVEDLKNFLPFN